MQPCHRPSLIPPSSLQIFIQPVQSVYYLNLKLHPLTGTLSSPFYAGPQSRYNCYPGEEDLFAPYEKQRDHQSRWTCSLELSNCRSKKSDTYSWPVDLNNGLMDQDKYKREKSELNTCWPILEWYWGEEHWQGWIGTHEYTPTEN